MKRSYLYRICGAWMLLLGAGCTSEGPEECIPCNKSGTVEVRLAGTLPETGLETPLYLFRRNAGTQDEYLFARNCGPVADGDALQLPLAEIAASDYRFLAIAQPAGGAWLTLQTAGGAPYAPGASWQELRLASPSGRAALDGYCGFTDLSGAAILSDSIVRLKLTRIAGQVLFDFFRTKGTVSQPDTLASAQVASVIDRVARIDIEYAEPTASLRFDEHGALTPAAYAAEPLKQRIVPDLENFKVSLPQADKGLFVRDTAFRGSLRIEGAPLLPSDSKLRVRLVFTYHDTTPTCGTPGKEVEEVHSPACYPLRQVELALPAADVPAGLPVVSDWFTVNRAGLRCDRIIDVPVGGTIDMDFGWL